jgi:hypothetical protein
MSSSRRGRSLAEVMSPIEDEGSVHPAFLTEPADLQLTRDADARSPIRGDASSQPVVPINILVTPEDRRRLKQLSLDCDLSLQKLGHEAWNLLLQQRGLPPLKPVSANVPSGRSSRRSG